MSALTSVRPGWGDTGVTDHAMNGVAAGRLPHPLLRATAWSSAIGLLAGLVLGVVTQVREHDGR